MAIVVYWMEDAAPHCASYKDHEFAKALSDVGELRSRLPAIGAHVIISTELAGSVGRAGVAAVEDGKTPDGFIYDFDKRHRGAGPGPKR